MEIIIKITYVVKKMLALSKSDPVRKSQKTKIWSILYPVYDSPFYFTSLLTNKEDFPGGSDGKASVCLQCGRPGFDPWVGKISWRRKWQSTPGLLPGKSHGQRSLVGYSPWAGKESDTTEQLH